MSEIREAIEAATKSEDRRFSPEYSKGRNAHSQEFILRLLRRVLENVDGNFTLAEVLEQLDEAIP